MKTRVKVFILLLFLSAIYICYSCVIKAGTGELALIEDKENGNFTLLHSGFNFAFQGIIPGRIQVFRYARKSASILDLTFSIPELQELKSDNYAVKMSFNLVYDVDADNLSLDPNIIGNDKSAVIQILKKSLAGFIAKGLSPYMDPYYNKAGILANQDKIIDKAREELRNYFKKIGINILDLDLMGSIGSPEMKTYYEGLVFNNQLREIEKNNKKELIILANNLEKEKRLRNDFLEKLSLISNLIKSNPDILKYIYIDRLAGNVKLIISSDKSGMPFGLSLDEYPDKTGKIKNSAKEEINNLR